MIKEGINSLAAVLHSFVSDEGMSSRTTKSKKHKHRRASSESEPSEGDMMDLSPKRLRVDDDALSIAPSDNDIHDFLNGSVATGKNTDGNAGQADDGDNDTVNDTPASRYDTSPMIPSRNQVFRLAQ